MMIEKLKALEIENGVMMLTFYSGMWSVHLTEQEFNAKFKTRLVKRLDSKYDRHFIFDENVEVFCLIEHAEPDPLVREVTL